MNAVGFGPRTNNVATSFVLSTTDCNILLELALNLVGTCSYTCKVAPKTGVKQMVLEQNACFSIHIHSVISMALSGESPQPYWVGCSVPYSLHRESSAVSTTTIC